MAAPSFVVTAALLAKRLGVDIEVIEELAQEMEPEDGCLSVFYSDDENAPSVTAFTRYGMQYLEELLDARRMKFMGDT